MRTLVAMKRRLHQHLSGLSNENGMEAAQVILILVIVVITIIPVIAAIANALVAKGDVIIDGINSVGR